MKPLPHMRPTGTAQATMHKRLHAIWAPLTLLLALVSAPAWPHGGEDHGDEHPTTTPARQAPRASAQTDTFELVVVFDQGEAPHSPALTIYLDKADTNEPVDQASIDVESGAFKASAKPVAPGVYSVPAAALAKPGRYPLTFTVQSADNADLLDTTLVTAPHEATAAQDAHGPHASAPVAHRARWPWLAAGAALLITAAWLARRKLARNRDLAGTLNSAPVNDSARHTA